MWKNSETAMYGFFACVTGAETAIVAKVAATRVLIYMISDRIVRVRKFLMIDSKTVSGLSYVDMFCCYECYAPRWCSKDL